MFVMKIKSFIYIILLKIGLVKPAYYINGAETLPPPLTSAEERELLKNANEDGRNKLIVHNLRLVVYIARKFDSAAVNIEDLISIGTIGLIKAVNTFCPEKILSLPHMPQGALKTRYLCF